MNDTFVLKSMETREVVGLHNIIPGQEVCLRSLLIKANVEHYSMLLFTSTHTFSITKLLTTSTSWFFEST